MGVVHLGADPEGRKVAIKVLRPQVAGDATALRRLAREVDSMRRVHNPHVAEIVEADVTAERPYIVTQYVPGRTLEEIVEDDGPVFGQALQRLAVGLASALSAIHGAGIIHRDLKPGNVMLVDSEPVVIDFGIAQGADATRLTATGMVIGTPGYLAPEIIEGEDAGAPSDVHSWAATAAFAATGRPPFGSGSFESIFYKIMQGTPDLDGVPEPLLPLIRAAMARHPAERPTAVNLVQLARRIHLETTITDQTRVDQPFRQVAQPPLDQPVELPTRRERTGSGGAGRTGRSAQAAPLGAALPPPAPRPEAPRHEAPPPPMPAPRQQVPRPEPAPAQPKDFKGLLPPAAPPPMPPPAPAPYEAGGYEPVPYGGGYPPYGGRPQTQPRQGRRIRRGEQAPQPAQPPQPPAPYDPYNPYGTQQRPDQRAPGAPGAPGEAGKPAKPYAIYRLLSLITLVGLLGFAGITPVIALGVVIVAVLVLRAADRSALSMESKRVRKGPRSGDVVGAVIKSPFALPRAALMMLLLVPLGLLAGIVVLLGLLVARPEMTVTRALSFGVMAVVVLLCLGPGSAAPRRQMARLWGFFLPRREPAMAIALVLGVFVAVMVILAAGQSPDPQPAGWLTDRLADWRQDLRDLLP